MQVHETNLKRLVQGEKQFRVPLWQRQYTWRIAEHRLLWRDILEQYAQVSDGGGGARSEHFLGSIVLSPVPSAASDVASYLIVDGQQRLTTLMLILAAIRDATAKTDARAIERYDELYLINKFQTGQARFRLLPTQADPSAEDDQELRAGLWRLRRWGAQTSYPVLMAAYDLRERGLLTIEGLREVVSYIESFLVRRQLAGIPTNALNRLFVQFVGHLPQDGSFPQALRRELSRQPSLLGHQTTSSVRQSGHARSTSAAAARSARPSSNDSSRATVTRNRSTSRPAT